MCVCVCVCGHDQGTQPHVTATCVLEVKFNNVIQEINAVFY